MISSLNPWISDFPVLSQKSPDDLSPETKQLLFIFYYRFLRMKKLRHKWKTKHSPFHYLNYESLRQAISNWKRQSTVLYMISNFPFLCVPTEYYRPEMICPCSCKIKVFSFSFCFVFVFVVMLGEQYRQYKENYSSASSFLSLH